MGRKVNMDLLEKKIEKAQDDVVKTKKEYDKATKALKDLLDKRDSIRREELINAISKSDRTYDEIMQFLKSKED